MAYDVKLPDIGEGVAEGEIVRWLVQPGERVREDQPLVEVMTDKASVEIPSPRAGVIAALHAEQGQIVDVGTVIISIDVEGEAPPAAPPPGTAARAPAPARAAAASVTVTTTAAPRAQATPAVRQLARQLGVAIELLTGSGPGGAITADDVKRAAASPREAPAGATAPAADRDPSGGSEERVPLRGLRRKIAEHMRHSLDI